MYDILFVSLVLGKRSGFCLISISGLRRNNKNWLPGSLDYSLLCKKRVVGEAVCYSKHTGLALSSEWSRLLGGGCLLRRQSRSWA